METNLITESRISIEEYFLSIAIDAAMRGTCARRKVGCVLVDRHNQILSTGFNGVASGLTHCTLEPCKGANLKSGSGLDICEAIHAEENALIQCRSPHEIYTAYVTASPCIKCTRKLLNTSCQNIVYLEEYPHEEAQNLWREHRSTWFKFGIDAFKIKPSGYDRLVRSNAV